MAGNENSQRSPEQIRTEIQQTRERMRTTIDTLETKLDPQRLKHQAADTIRDQTVGRVEDFADDATRRVKGAGSDVFETIKNNPLPAALVAIGLGWLFMERRSNQQPMPRQARPLRSAYDYDYGYRYYDENGAPRGADFRNPRSMQDMQGQVRGTMNQAQDKAQQVANQAQDKAQQVADQAQQLAGQAQDKAQQFADQAQDKVQEWSDSAQQQASRVRSRFEDLMDENPLIVGAAAMALGAAIGMSLPSTPQEDQLIGNQRDQLMNKAQSAAADTMDKVQHVAQRAGTAAQQAAQDEAQKQNLTTSR